MADGGFITELGAMHLPLQQHPLTNIFVTERYQLKVTPFRGYDSNALFYITGRRRTLNERIVPDENGFNVYAHEKNKVRRPTTPRSILTLRSRRWAICGTKLWQP